MNELRAVSCLADSNEIYGYTCCSIVFSALGILLRESSFTYLHGWRIVLEFPCIALSAWSLSTLKCGGCVSFDRLVYHIGWLLRRRGIADISITSVRAFRGLELCIDSESRHLYIKVRKDLASFAPQLYLARPHCTSFRAFVSIRELTAPPSSWHPTPYTSTVPTLTR